ncbi:L,D-transpeptidase [Gluconacetobacter takamatsuzukensis]|uniref:L,D-transpeptidase n=1 Tax=Gluconacetobacter takamatsuzukensis TaxID=1286190 RepID=UPI0038D17632
MPLFPETGVPPAVPVPGPMPSPGPMGAPSDSANPAIDIPPLPALDDDAARAEAQRLLVDLRREVPHFQRVSPGDAARWIALARAQLARAHVTIDRAQVLMVVDRNPRVQRVCFVLALPDDDDWLVLGGTRVSTGQAGRKYYYVTPTGVFINSPDRLGYRAEGTRNEHGIRGLGARGMRVWDMGWQWAVKGWRPDREQGQIRLEIHATDPDFLEARLGRPASEGCVRIPAALNRFMDRHGLLDAQYERAASYDGRFRALLPKDRMPSPIAGDAMVVVDSSLGEGMT